VKPLIKVDRVKSFKEALELQDLNVDIITPCLLLDPRFDDGRETTLNEFILMRKLLTKVKLCHELDLQETDYSQSEDIKADFIQIFKNRIPSDDFLSKFKDSNSSFIYKSIGASYDDDPAWIISEIEQIEIPNISYFQLDLLNDINDAWNFFKNECPSYEDELQINDVNKIAFNYPLIISLDFSPTNIVEIISFLPNVNGLNFTLGSNPKRDDFHWLSYPDLLDTLKILNGVD
jgi:hypothetical protein